MISRSSVNDSFAAAAGSAPAAAFAASSAATSAPASKPASTAAARLAFRAATARMPSSTEDAWHMRITVTGRFWPSRCARSCACWSYVGFQSGSARITVSALCRLIPKPPARVLHRYTKCLPSGLLNSAVSYRRRAREVEPSKRRCANPRASQNSSSMSSINVNCEKIKTLCPPARRRGSISSSAVSLPEAATSASARTPPCAAIASRAVSSPNKNGWQHTLRSCMSKLESLVNCWFPPPPPTFSSPAPAEDASSLCSAMHLPLSSASFSEVALDAASFPNKPCSPSRSVLYSLRCSSERGMRTTVSVFGGRIFWSTFALVRLNISG
mmetsp:Transcript_3872/g.16457  ORF Transcript_3872/g.16457 Transcript_3872/m.16457 type:complete len:327 (+) Transcript_3872:3146-4126(+)